MDPIKFALVMSLFALLFLGICWLDYKKGWQLVDWINGRCSNPFKHSAKAQKTEPDKDALIQQLTERVQVLEKIVTEPSYELNKKLSQL